MSHMQVFHPTAKMLVELSSAQDIEAGDGTTSVVVLAGSLLNACQGLLEKGIHPTSISEAFQMAQAKAEEILRGVSHPVCGLTRVLTPLAGPDVLTLHAAITVQLVAMSSCVPEYCTIGIVTLR